MAWIVGGRLGGGGEGAAPCFENKEKKKNKTDRR